MDPFATRLHRLACVAFLAGCAPPMYEATDGSVFQGKGEPSHEAAIASAVRDLPCDRASIVVVGRERFYTADDEFRVVPNVLEGCGERVIYQVVHANEAGDAAGRYLMVSRVPSLAAASRSPMPMATPAPTAR
jgi:hypothetical protein